MYRYYTLSGSYNILNRFRARKIIRIRARCFFNAAAVFIHYVGAKKNYTQTALCRIDDGIFVVPMQDVP